MIVAGWADGYRNNTFRTVARARRRRDAAPAARRAVGARRPDHRDARAADRLRRRAGRLVRPLAARRRGRTRTAATSSCAPRPGPSPTSTCTRATGCELPSVPPTSPTTCALRGPALARRSIADVGTAAWIDCAGHLPWGLSGDQRLDDARSLTWDLDPPAGAGRRPPRSRGCGSRPTRPAASLSVKLCDVFPDGTSALVSRGTLDLAFRDGVHGAAGAAGARARRTTSRSSSTPAPTRGRPGQRAAGQRRRRRLAQHHRSPGAGDAHRARRPRSSCRCSTAIVAGADVRPGRRALDRSPPRASPGRSTTTCCARHHDGAHACRSRSTTRRTTAARCEDYRGEVSVDRRTFAQRAHADTTLRAGLARRRRPGAVGDGRRRRRAAGWTRRSAPSRSATVRSSASGPGSAEPG